MKNVFNSYVTKLHNALNELLDKNPVKPNKLPGDVPGKGIYLFSEGNKHLYVGRTNNLRRRIQNHYRPSSGHNQATFTFKIAREKTQFKKATYKTNG